MQIWYTHEFVSTPIVLNPRQPVVSKAINLQSLGML